METVNIGEGEIESIDDPVAEDAAVCEQLQAAERSQQSDSEVLSAQLKELPWEVECTDDVWKYLTNNKLDIIRRKKILQRIQRIASGEWHLYVARRIKSKARKRFTTVCKYNSKI